MYTAFLYAFYGSTVHITPSASSMTPFNAFCEFNFENQLLGSIFVNETEPKKTQSDKPTTPLLRSTEKEFLQNRLKKYKVALAELSPI
jgi:hypothetical protein